MNCAAGMQAAENLVHEIRRVLAENADPEKAPQMQSYMKSAMPFRGIQAGPRRKLCRSIFKECPLPDRASWASAILRLWRDAAHREERYAALDLARFGRYNSYRTIECLPMYEEMIVSGAWWDYVDELAVRHVRTLLDDEPAYIKPILRSWSNDPDIWKRRTSIICQILRRRRTDTVLLTDCIIPSLDRKEFFLRKAIGWALRAHSLVDPAFVRTFAETHADRLSPLSRKEALRRIGEE